MIKTQNTKHRKSSDLAPQVAWNVVVLVALQCLQRLLEAAAAGRGRHHPPVVTSLR